MILAGKLDRKISIYGPPSGTGSFGEPSSAGALVLNGIWAGLVESAGKEAQFLGGESLVQPRIFVVRHRTTINETMQVEWKGRRYKIVQIEYIDRNQEMLLYCSAVV